MLEVVLRPHAEADLEAIAEYTRAQWGEAQAKRYILEIRRQIEAATQYPAMGSAAFGLPAAYRKVRSGHYRATCRYTETEFIVVCIIDEREDVPDEIEDFWQFADLCGKLHALNPIVDDSLWRSPLILSLDLTR
jgi:toxin ParE1/3/4